VEARHYIQNLVGEDFYKTTYNSEGMIVVQY